MRKLLLASAAVLGASVGLTAYASAQTLPLPEMQGQLVTRPSSGGGANNNNNYQGTMLPGPVANPTPGSMVIHFYGRVLTGVGGEWSSINNTGGYKLQPQSMFSYMRLYPGVDAMATNGLRYGASIELRENFGSQTSSTSPSAYTSTETVFVRRAFVYAGTDQAGIVRIGQADGLIGIYDNGVTTFQFLPTGNLNGGDIEAANPSPTQVPFAFAGQAGSEYGNTKLVYLSPQFAGFDVGLQYAPNMSNSENSCNFQAAGTTNVTGVTSVTSLSGYQGCSGLSASPIASDSARVINQFAAGARYQAKFGDVGVLGYAVYMGSGHVNNTAGANLYDNMSLGSFGLAVTYAGLTVGGNVITGQVNGQLALKPKGGADETGVLIGAKYVTGPITVGVVGESINSQGSTGLVGISQRHEFAIDTGASYAIAPGLTLWGEYDYQQRHQGDFNFVTNGTGTANNNVDAQGVMLGAMMTW